MDVRAAFGPEHEFRGDLPDGEKAADGTDPTTGLPIHSLYGTHKKPTAAQLAPLDVVLFDIQDVGVRCYTYLSTLMLVAEACAEEDVALVSSTAPTPMATSQPVPCSIQLQCGPLSDSSPFPLAHGMTLGELAEMAQGEGLARWRILRQAQSPP